jgi:3'-5' exoribonuclease
MTDPKHISSPAYPDPEARPYLAELKGIPNKSIFLTYALLLRCELRTAKNGGEFLSIELGDQSQALFCTVFTDNPIYNKLKTMESGTILKIQGITDYYMEKLSPKLLKVSALPQKEWSEEILTRLVRSTDNDVEAMFSDILGAVEGIQTLPLRLTVEQILSKAQSDFCFKPAAKSIHHAYRSGLLEHTWSMLQVTQNLLPHYSQLNKDIVVASILLHDFGKIREYCGDLNTDMSVEGRLLGHIFMGAHTFLATAEQNNVPLDYAQHVTHCILSHHRMPEWGAAMRPATPEASFVCMVDGMDSLMGVIDNARFSHGSSPITPFVPAIDSPLVWSPPNPQPAPTINPDSLPEADVTETDSTTAPTDVSEQPPAEQPPAEQPPAEQPPAKQPPAEQPPAKADAVPAEESPDEIPL